MTGLVIGLAVALVASVGAYFLGSATGGKPVATPSVTASPSLRLFEANQKTINQAKLTGDTAPLAQRWLPYLAGCVADNENGGTKLQPDETKHVVCRYGGASVQFAQYRSEADLNAERDFRRQLNQTTNKLEPGEQPPAQKEGGASHAMGDYVEYALKGRDGKPLCGIWWNLNHSDAGMYIEALCHEVLADQWAPLRDLWQEYS